MKFNASELSFVVISATLLFYAKSAATNLPLAVDMETVANVYISPLSIVLTDRNVN